MPRPRAWREWKGPTRGGRGTWIPAGEEGGGGVGGVGCEGGGFVEARGLWEVYNDFMGGPFVSHSFYSKDGRYIIVLDGFVYAPKFDKRQYLRQVEAIMYSFEWEKEDEEGDGNK